MTRFPFAPLAELIEAQWRPKNAEPRAGGGLQRVTIVGKATDLLDVDANTVRRWITRGLDPLIADRSAVHLGYHPSLIWPDWFDIDIPETDLFAPACTKATWQTVKQHQRHGEPFCRECLQFKARWARDKRRAA